MLVLALDTATPAVVAGVVDVSASDTPEVLGSQQSVNPRAHSELLVPHVSAAAAQAGVKLAELDAVVVGVGPGPFTGLRVGIVTAAAFGDALGKPVYPACTLDAIALASVQATVPGSARAPDAPQHPGADTAGLLVVTDARRREVYWAAYGVDGSRRAGPQVRRPGELAALLPELGVSRAAGHGATLYRDTVGLPITEPEYPTPAGLALAAGDALRNRAEPGVLTPLYLRRPDAVEPTSRKRATRDDHGGSRRSALRSRSGAHDGGQV